MDSENRGTEVGGQFAEDSTVSLRSAQCTVAFEKNQREIPNYL